MNNRSFVRGLAAIFAVAALACSAAFAGGPLAIFDPATKTAYTWPGGNPPVYTDLGTLGQLSNDQANAMMAFSVNQWNAVPSSSLHATIAGNFATLGLPDIDSSNLSLVLGTWNGGGIHVIYDADGSIMTEIFGSPYGVLGVTITEYVSDTSPDIAEVTMILNGTAVPDESWATPEEAAAMYAGVTTHEFGHAVGLAHSQTNGQIILGYDLYTGPAECATPYASAPIPDDMETMYPFTYLNYTGVAESTVDVLDDVSAISDLYPVHGWPRNYASISGTIQVATTPSCPRNPGHGGSTSKAAGATMGSGSGVSFTPDATNSSDDDSTSAPSKRVQPNRSRYSPLMGANVIARNVANPYHDAVSAISGDYTQGIDGPDGTYRFNGLTRNASYIVYVDGLLYGAFSTPYPTVLPGPEEYWNGSQESGDGLTDDRCAWQTVRARSGRDASVDVTFNKVKDAPEFIPIDLPYSSITELSGNGQTAVGVWQGGVYRWTSDGFEVLGGSQYSPQAGISHDGKTITSSVDDASGINNAAIYTDATGWTMIPPGPNSASCDIDLTSGWGVSDNKTVVGLDWLGCANTSAFRWSADTGFTDLGYLLETDFGSSRANKISADASTIVGWDRGETGFWRGAVWQGNQETTFTQPPVMCCDWDPVGCLVSDVGTANAVNPDGSIIVGEYYATQQSYTDPDTGDIYHYCSNSSWKWTAGGGVQPLGEFPGYTPIATDVSDDGKVVVGLGSPDDFFSPRVATIWTEATGFLNFQDFLKSQGTWANDWGLAVAGTVSGDGKTVGGYAGSPLSIQGFIVKMPKVIMCHTENHHTDSGHHTQHKETISVPFPDGLASHLAQGDTIGMCQNGN